MEIIEDDIEPKFQKDIITMGSTYYDYVTIGDCIMYDYERKQLFPIIDKNTSVFIGQFLNKDNTLYNILYKGFFLKDPISIGANIKEKYVQIYVKKEFEHARDSIISLMPRTKKLKRLNLKMLTRELALLLYENIDKIIRNYELIFGYEQSQIFKASLVTTPFFINDNGIIKLYSIEKNELYDLDVESEGNFLAYFTFQHK